MFLPKHPMELKVFVIPMQLTRGKVTLSSSKCIQ